MQVPFNTVLPIGNEEKYLIESLRSGKWCGRGPMTLTLEKQVKNKLGVKHAFFVTSCSSALEVGCLVAGLKPGDEVIIPSFGFVSAANAVLAAGAKPVFADIDQGTWNISVETVKKVVTPKTRAVLPVHYAGSSAGMGELHSFCREGELFLIEDAAQSLGSKREGKFIGPTPWVACFSLHETKNISCGEGGLITTDSDNLAEKIEIIIEKGTNRQRFFRGQVDKYTWVERGGSYIASDLLAAVALAQFEKLDAITARRLEIAKKYHSALSEFEEVISWQKVPNGIEVNGHIVAFKVRQEIRDQVIADLKEQGIGAVFHYIPLHNSPYAQALDLMPEKALPQSVELSECLIRIPVFNTMGDEQVQFACDVISKVLTRYR
jgi:dTDP-4-amino-4,6-dideoxygalactose transaminase